MEWRGAPETPVKGSEDGGVTLVLSVGEDSWTKRRQSARGY